jgi:hypothetical protein
MRGLIGANMARALNGLAHPVRHPGGSAPSLGLRRNAREFGPAAAWRLEYRRGRALERWANVNGRKAWQKSRWSASSVSG